MTVEDDGVIEPRPSPAPRAVPGSLTRRGRTAALLGMLFVLLGPCLGLGFALAGSPFDDQTLDQRGLRVSAQPVDARKVSTSNHADRFELHVQLRFVDDEGAEHEVTLATGDPARIEAAGAQVPMNIDFDPLDPSVARFSGTRLSLGFGLYYLFGLISSVGLLVVLGALVHMLRVRALARTGELVLGKIVEVESYTHNNQQVYALRYTYTVAGQTHHDRSTTRAPAEEGPIWVVHSATQPGRSLPAIGWG